MLRTTRTVPSTKPLMVSTCRRDCSSDRTASPVDRLRSSTKNGRQSLAHFVVQLARQRPAFFFLRLNQSRREFLELRARFRHLHILRAGLVFQT